MGGLRLKMLMALIIYFAGFSSAIYYQAPALDADQMSERQLPAGRHSSDDTQSTKGEQLAGRVQEQLKEFCSFAEEKASKVGALIKERLDEQ